MSEGREVKTPNFLCCIANVRGAEIWSGVRLLFNLIFLMASSVYVSKAKVHSTKKAAIKVNNNTFHFSMLGHPSIAFKQLSGSCKNMYCLSCSIWFVIGI